MSGCGVGVGVAGVVGFPGWWKVLKGTGCMKSHDLMPTKNDMVLRKSDFFSSQFQASDWVTCFHIVKKQSAGSWGGGKKHHRKLISWQRSASFLGMYGIESQQVPV